jgi:uncharacterized protein YkwD
VFLSLVISMSNTLKPVAGTFLACFCALGLGGVSSSATQIPSSSRPTGSVLNLGRRYYAYQPRRINYLRQVALDLANQDRSRHGFSALRPDALLTKAAQRHAEDMLRRKYFSHYSPEGRTPSDRFLAVGGRIGAAENIFTMRDSSLVNAPIGVDRLAFFERGWMRSPGHRRNLLDRRYGRFGFGLAASGDRLYAVQLFSFN